MLHGLRVTSDLDLATPPSAHDDAAVDLDIELGLAREISDATPPGELSACLPRAGRGYAVTLDRGTAHVRFFGRCDIEYDMSRRSALVSAAPGIDEDRVATLVVTNLIALVLGLDGCCALHASAVTIDGRALAFVGPSGSGKSTLATLLASDGSRLLSDDLLRIEPPAIAHRGGGETRLRPGTTALAASFTADRRRPTGDGRVAVRPERTVSVTAPVDLVAFPTWRRATTSVAVERLGARATLERLLRYPRVTGWLAPGPLQAHFRGCAAMAERVVGVELGLPYGVSLDAALAHEISARLGEQLP